MYIGRFLVAGPGVAGYRVSSRSFPNRTVTDRGDRLTVVPTDEADPTDNPYVSYNAVRVVSHHDTTTDASPNDTNTDSSTTTTLHAGASRAVIGNGSHVDPTAEKLARGYPPRDALVESLHALDYEKDDYDTPRIAAVVSRDAAHVGIVRRDALLVRRVTEPHLVATYERDDPRPYALDADSAVEAARAVYTADFEHAVCAAGVRIDTTVTTAVHDAD